ncbi:MAG: carbohydrate binding domain-containing protein [Bacteroidetes bacterium]|nr:carbohydrate binding domain-containing protein [Bacteroidota bacterium]
MLWVEKTHAQAPEKLSVRVDKTSPKIQPTMWGVFFEDINFAADGGIYAEMVKNRSFEFADPTMGWDDKQLDGSDASLLIVNRGNGSNARYASISLKNGKGSYVLINEGFRGMGFEKGHQYNFSILAHTVEGNVKVKVEAVDEKGKPIGHASLEEIKGDWETYRVSLTPTESASNGKLNVIFEGQGKLEIDMVSLFPADTWKHRPNGMRADLVQKLADLKPGFMRFPGGCIVEGRDLANRYQWKSTVGDVADRKLIINRWNMEMKDHQTPDYFQSFGLGFYEYFQLCEDIGASPLPILNCGMACQYNSAEVVSLNQIDPFIQDALDLIEFANGGADTKWGKLRAAMGHPAPFNLKMIGVGNEQWGEQYVDRFRLFSKAIWAKYPEIKLVGSAGPYPGGDLFDYLSKVMRDEKASLIDEHYYMRPEWFLKNVTRYDNYNRNSSKVFAGEYAAHIDDKTQKDTHPESHNTWYSALSEAAFMTGLERNADVVQMASYAPLLARVDAWQWRPDLIWFDNLHSVATPNYYVQQMFSKYKGTNIASVLLNGKAVTGQDSLYSSAVFDSYKKQLIIKVVNASTTPRNIELNVEGSKGKNGNAEWIQLASSDKLLFNSIDNPYRIHPETRTIGWNYKKQEIKLESLSVNVLIVSYTEL